ncbi:MAG: multicopper oxidase domain-containing protein [Actinomycetota bacterium]|nr:multicopper oxidase domain-containing protein [Actinomycetota bacterium]
MQRNAYHRRQRATAAILALGLAGLVGVVGGPSPAPVAAAGEPLVGIVCSTGPTFHLETDADYIALPDGNTAYMYGYKPAGGAFQHPGPVLCVQEGDTVTVTLTNTLPRDVSIMFPGQENVLADGQPAQPQFSTPGDLTTLTSLTNVATANGGTVTYQFVASHPGTFLYESGTDPEVQVRMGLFGALIVRPAMGADYAYNRADSRFTTEANSAAANNTEEFLVLLSEIDPFLNQAVENRDRNGASSNFNLDNYHPRYWLVNGRGFPDSIADNYASWLPNQPYGALAEVTPSDDPALPSVGHPFGGMARYINVGTENYPFHPHGNNGKVIGRDGHPLEGPGSEDLSYEKFAINIGPGQTYDVLFRWYDAEHYHPVSNPVPVEVPQVANQTFGMFYSGSPYLGVVGPQPPGNQSLNQCGEYYIISHNHALYQITSWGVNMTGPITYMRIDPTAGSSCP